MNGELFAQQIEAMRWRLQKLYQDASELPVSSQDFIPRAFMELGTASEELQVAVEELRQKNEELRAAQAFMESERQHYQELFNFAPNAYLVTDASGNIREANRAAALLLNVSQERLVGQPIMQFAPEERRIFRNQLNRLCEGSWLHEWEMKIVPHRGNPIDTHVTVAVVKDTSGKIVSLRWLVRSATNSSPQNTATAPSDCNPLQDCLKHSYSRGEIISLQPEMVWLVCEGLVKLSTLAENGVEVLVGLVGPGMAFGSGLTDLPIYQAMAFSKDVQLVCVSIKEIETSPVLTQLILPRINQRLRQTESLLAISGQRRVSERLQRLLLLLKRLIGQQVAEGTRLSVRLTHEDFANACGTTRVTITRLLNKLHQRGAISFDPQHHIILHEESF